MLGYVCWWPLDLTLVDLAITQPASAMVLPMESQHRIHTVMRAGMVRPLKTFYLRLGGNVGEAMLSRLALGRSIRCTG